MDNVLSWTAVLPTVQNDTNTCCTPQKTTSPTPTHTPFTAGYGTTDQADPSGWLYKLVGTNFGDAFVQYTGAEVSSFWPGLQLTVPYSGCPYTACPFVPTSTDSPVQFASSRAYLFETIRTTVSSAAAAGRTAQSSHEGDGMRTHSPVSSSESQQSTASIMDGTPLARTSTSIETQPQQPSSVHMTEPSATHSQVSSPESKHSSSIVTEATPAATTSTLIQTQPGSSVDRPEPSVPTAQVVSGRPQTTKSTSVLATAVSSPTPSSSPESLSTQDFKVSAAQSTDGTDDLSTLNQPDSADSTQAAETTARVSTEIRTVFGVLQVPTHSSCTESCLIAATAAVSAFVATETTLTMPMEVPEISQSSEARSPQTTGAIAPHSQDTTRVSAARYTSYADLGPYIWSGIGGTVETSAASLSSTAAQPSGLPSSVLPGNASYTSFLPEQQTGSAASNRDISRIWPFILIVGLMLAANVG